MKLKIFQNKNPYLFINSANVILSEYPCEKIEKAMKLFIT